MHRTPVSLQKAFTFCLESGIGRFNYRVWVILLVIVLWCESTWAHAWTCMGVRGGHDARCGGGLLKQEGSNLLLLYKKYQQLFIYNVSVATKILALSRIESWIITWALFKGNTVCQLYQFIRFYHSLNIFASSNRGRWNSIKSYLGFVTLQ